MRTWRWLLVFLLVSGSVWAQAAPETAIRLSAPLGAQERLVRARNCQEYGDYACVIQVLQEGVTADIFTDAQQSEVHRLLGMALYISQRPDEAREHFLAMLLADPDITLDPLVIPPAIMEMVESIRKERKPLLDSVRAQRAQLQAERERRAVKKAAANRQPPRSLLFTFVPFGFGQFYNGDDGKGAAFLSSELALLTLNVASYFVSRGFAGPDGYYSHDNAVQARRWRAVQFGTLGALGAVAITGIIEAALHYKSGEPADTPAEKEP